MTLMAESHYLSWGSENLPPLGVVVGRRDYLIPPHGDRKTRRLDQRPVDGGFTSLPLMGIENMRSRVRHEGGGLVLITPHGDRNASLAAW